MASKQTRRAICKKLEHDAAERARLDAEKRERCLRDFKPANVGDMLREIGRPR